MKIGTKISAALCLAFLGALAAFLPSYLALLHARQLFLSTFPSSAMMPGTPVGELNEWLMIGVASTVLGATVVLAVFMTIALRTSRSIVQPLKIITGDLEQVAQGDFTTTTVLDREDEIGDLSRAVGAMIRALDQKTKDAAAAEADLAARTARYRGFAEASADWLWETDDLGRVTFFSGDPEGTTGPDPRSVIGKPFEGLFSVRREDGSARALELESRRPMRSLICEFSDGGDIERTVLVSGTAISDANGSFTGYRGIARDVTGHAGHLQTSDHMSDRDPLTGLPNRAHILDRLRQMLSARAFTKSGVAVLHLDLDRFSAIIELHGQAAADAVIEAVAHRLTALIGPQDILRRLEGGAFAIIQPFGAEQQAADALCRSLLAAVSGPIRIDTGEVRVTASIGCALCGGETVEPSELMRNAEIAMYRAKHDGRDTYRFHDTDMAVDVAAREATERDLVAAIAGGTLEVLYQPIVAGSDHTLIGFEASLLRPGTGHAANAHETFLTLTAAGGHEPDLFAFLLKTACSEAARWPDLTLSVDLSPALLSSGALVQLVGTALRESGLSPHLLELEIPEQVLSSDTGRLAFHLDALRELGVRLILDHFGDTAGSIRPLQQCRFDGLKLGERFVTGMCKDPEKAAVVGSVIAAAAALGTEVGATGIESERDAACLLDAGCERLQGSLFGDPMPSGAARAFFKTQERPLERVTSRIRS